MPVDTEMLQLAASAMDAAYAPYSSFPVGAVVRGESGRLYAGCNVENAAYPSGSCAEQSAIAAMILGGDHRLVEIAVMGRGEALVTPCGACRQRIREFAVSEDVPVHVCGPEGVRKTVPFSELLPLSFGPDNLA